MRRMLFAAGLAAIAIVLSGAPSRAQNAYITNIGSNTVSVIATASNTVTATITVGFGPLGVAVTPDGSHVYVTNQLSGTVSVIATASNTVIATTPVGSFPHAFGVFIVAAMPTLTCAGTPGFSNCRGQCVAALVHHYGGVSAACRHYRLQLRRFATPRWRSSRIATARYVTDSSSPASLRAAPCPAMREREGAHPVSDGKGEGLSPRVLAISHCAS
jgi:YVTN family beta-propeller protein